MSSLRNEQAQLEDLYARLLAIDQLIASLETYDRYRATASTTRQQQLRSA